MERGSLTVFRTIKDETQIGTYPQPLVPPEIFLIVSILIQERQTLYLRIKEDI